MLSEQVSVSIVVTLAASLQLQLKVYNLIFRGKIVDWISITGVSSVVIALCALGYTIWQGKQTQNHNKLSLRPHLTTWSHHYSNRGSYAVEIINNGLGPALIESFTIKIDNKVIAGNGLQPIEKALKILFPNQKYESQQAYMGNGYSMAPKERCEVLSIQFIEPHSLTQEVIEHTLDRADLIIRYKSFYEEKFLFSSEDKKSDTKNPN